MTFENQRTIIENERDRYNLRTPAFYWKPKVTIGRSQKK